MACAVSAGRKEQKNCSSVFPQVSDEASVVVKYVASSANLKKINILLLLNLQEAQINHSLNIL